MSETNIVPSYRGFLINRSWDDERPTDRSRAFATGDAADQKLDGRVVLSFWLVSEYGPLRVVFSGQQAVFFIPKSKLEKARQLLQDEFEYGEKPLPLNDFCHEPVLGFYFNEQRVLYRAREILRQHLIFPYESDIQPTDRFLMERFITGGMEIAGQPVQRAGFLEFKNPKVKVAAFTPVLRVCSLDIETSMVGDKLYSIAAVIERYTPAADSELASSTTGGTADNNVGARVVFMVGAAQAQGRDPANDGTQDYLCYCRNEREVFTRFLQWFQRHDPDIIIGWNVINFDLRFLQRKADALNLPFRLGRNGVRLDWRQSRNDDDHYTLSVPGRAVLDGIDTLKSATYNFESFSLESVANEVLNRGKLIHNVDNRGQEITELFLKDKPALAAYNLEDCQLVWDIFCKTQLIHFAVERARLTGLAIDRFGGSVASFDNRYLPLLHRQGYVAPNLPVEPEGVGSPGGYVMDSQPGLYRNVLVLDFKSLYPSIIRTFKIDPLARILADKALSADEEVALLWDRKETDSADREAYVPGFNGAAFVKSPSLLPDIIGELWLAREEAKQAKNAAMSQAIKILMNSFYGVLGTPGCRFFDHRLPSSITLRGHEILSRTKVLIEEQGHQVIYGDTDSVFVWLKGTELAEHEASDAAYLSATGSELSGRLNRWWTDYLRENYQLDSYLEIEFETSFSHFLMPTIRGSEKGSKKRYAGRIAEAADNTNDDGDSRLVFKGLEAVRTDWTELARNFQRELYRRVFYQESYEAYIRQTVQDIYRGTWDNQLIYRKRLRRRLDDYSKNIPPHVQAARIADRHRADQGLAPRYAKGGWIQYVITTQGPEPLDYCSSSLDYDFYVERQIEPIVDGIVHFLDSSYAEIAGKQMGLF